MLVPEGYALFKTVETSLRACVAAAHPFEDGMTLRRLLVEREDLMDACWGEFFRKCGSLSLISPAGAVFRVQSEVGRRGRDGDAQPYWVFLDPLVWAVETRKVVERRKQKFSAFQSIVELKDDVEIDEDFERLLGLDLAREWSYEGFASKLEEREGWSISCKEADVPRSVEYFGCLSSLVGRFSASDEHEETARRGAPRQKRDGALEALQSLYPDGLVTDSQKVVLSKLILSGITVSVRTLGRVLKEFQELKVPE